MDSSMERVTNEFKLEASSKEKVTNELELVVSKREILEKSFQSQWKDLEEGFVSVKKLTEERIEEAEKSSERRFEAKEKRLLAMQKAFDEEKSAFEKKKKLDEQKQEWRAKRLEAKSKAIDVRNEEVEFREKQIESVRETIEKRFDVLEEEEKRIRLMRQSIDERLIEVELKESELDVKRKAAEKQWEAVQSQEKEFVSIQKSIEERLKEVALMEKRGNAERCSNEQFSRELELKAEMITEKLKKLESSELSSIQRNNELENLPCSSNPVNLQFFVTMDGKTLQMFLNNRLAGGCQSLDDEVYIVIQTSSDPAKLVLDAMQGFYPPHLKEGDTEFEATTARKICILLLRQLMRVSPPLKPHVLEEAMKLAGEWQSKMNSENSLEVLGFLHLVASYRFASYYKLEELLSLWQMLDEHEQSPQLCQALGFANKAPLVNVTDFIQLLINKNLHLEAIKYIYAFELADKFAPVSLLKAYLKHSEKVAEKIRKENLHGSENEATSKEVTALRAVIQCIVDHNLESEFSPESLKERISQLQKGKAGRKHIVMDQPIQQSEKKRKKHTAPTHNLTHTSASIPTPIPLLTHTSASTSAPDFKAQPPQHCGKESKKHTIPNSNPDPILTCTSASTGPSITSFTRTFVPTEPLNSNAQPPQHSRCMHPCNDLLAKHLIATHGNATPTRNSLQPHDWSPQFNQSAGRYSVSGSPSMNLSAGPYGLAGTTSSVTLHHTSSSAGEYRPDIADNRSTPQFGFAGPLNGYPGNVNAQYYLRPGTHPSMDHTARFNPSVPFQDADAAPGYYDRPTSGGV